MYRYLLQFSELNETGPTPDMEERRNIGVKPVMWSYCVQRNSDGRLIQ
jgi:hypothetical protein